MATWPSVLLTPTARLQWRIAALAPVQSRFGFRERSLDFHLLWHVTDGGAEVRLASGAAQSLRQGSLMWLPPGTVHTVWIPTGAKPMFAYSFSFRVVDAQGSHAFEQPILRDHEPSAGALLEELHTDRALADRWSDERSRALLFTLYTGLMRGAGRPGGGGLSTSQRLALVRYLERHLHHRPDPADLAAVVGLSPDYFARSFRRSFGISPKSWIVQQRIRRAAFLLQHGDQPTVAAVAEALGYEDQNLFSRQFAKVMGQTPRSCRAG